MMDGIVGDASKTLTTVPPDEKAVTHNQLKQALLIVAEGVMKLQEQSDVLLLATEQLNETLEELANDLREEIFRGGYGRGEV
jgi:hypothetical protein